MAVIHEDWVDLPAAFIAGFGDWVLDRDLEVHYQNTPTEALAYSLGNLGINARQNRQFSSFLFRKCVGQDVAAIIGFLDGFECVGDNFEWQHHEELASEYETFWRVGSAVWKTSQSGARGAGFQAYRQARVASEQSATAG